MSKTAPDLQNLRMRLLSEPLAARDSDGYCLHAALPATDEDVNMAMLLGAHGIATRFLSMESDAPALADAYFESGTPDCSAWAPTTPEGEGWKLLGIYDTEDGPHAMFGREDQDAAFPRRQHDADSRELHKLCSERDQARKERDACKAEIAGLEASCSSLGQLAEDLRPGHDRYQFLRNRDLDTVKAGGIFAGKTPDNLVLNGEDLDAAIDAAIAKEGGAA